MNDPPGRFLMHDPGSNLWYEASLKDALKKLGAAFYSQTKSTKTSDKDARCLLNVDQLSHLKVASSHQTIPDVGIPQRELGPLDRARCVDSRPISSVHFRAMGA